MLMEILLVKFNFTVSMEFKHPLIVIQYMILFKTTILYSKVMFRLLLQMVSIHISLLLNNYTILYSYVNLNNNAYWDNLIK